MKTKIILLLLIIGQLACSKSLSAEELVIYSTRNASFLQPLINEYSQNTGTQILYVTGAHRVLMKRLKTEGSRSSADIYLTASAANLWQAAELGHLQPIDSEVLEDNIPAQYRAQDHTWFGLSKRPRTIVYNHEKVAPEDLSSYADLASDKWKGRLCLRSGKDDYSRAMVAMMIHREGEEKTANVLRGWVDNLGYQPLQDDMHILEAIHQGACDIGIINTYYFARFNLQQPDHTLKLFWADQKADGVYVDVTGAGVTSYSNNRERAIDFLEWLTDKRPQSLYAKLGREYPVHQKVYPVREVAKWGRFKEDAQNVGHAGELKHSALKLIKATGYQ